MMLDCRLLIEPKPVIRIEQCSMALGTASRPTLRTSRGCSVSLKPYQPLEFIGQVDLGSSVVQA